ncbi:hypothetical protein I6F21_26390 [Bradyrhizobium sp. NBAIM03]|uniref:hypothetical protein n=1 Tax=Bradyrhizobium sp. NBAIM03 TaxID=2793816 RepID=UPI001CD686F6|nr:hypothetical protein [Bradyrhizobium sp. NBAIM03]MCA1536069.1 hypothetical protein [Bradyrhizobium sp. NBAIM03]
MELVCDNSELNGIWGAEAPDILVIGGYAIRRDMTVGLLERVKAFKAKHGLDSHCPVKWNMRDLDRPLAAHGLENQKQILIENSDAIRTDLLDALTTAGAVIFVSIIHAYSNNKQVLGKTKQDLVGYSFGNLLMRVGLFCKDSAGGRRVDSLLDWPEANNRAPFTSEYHTGWRYGRSGPEQGGVKYQCGPLAQIAFAPTVAFAGMEFEPRLQLADLVVGAGREFINYSMGKSKKEAFGVQRFKALLPHLYQANGQTLGRGITVSPTNGDLSAAVLKALKSL